MAAPRLVRTGPVPGPQAGAEGSQDAQSGQVFAGVGQPGPAAGDVTVPGPGARDRGGVRSWPLLLLAVPAAVAVWSGWVGIGELTGFGQVHPLPGIWSSPATR
jgi:hypothetical protein